MELWCSRTWTILYRLVDRKQKKISVSSLDENYIMWTNKLFDKNDKFLQFGKSKAQTADKLGRFMYRFNMLLIAIIQYEVEDI